MNQNLILNYYFYIKFIYIIKYASITSSGIEFWPTNVHAELFWSCPTLCHPVDCSLPESSVHGACLCPGKNIVVGWHALLHGIFWIQGLNLCLLHLLHWQMGSFTTSTSWEALVKIKPMSRYTISSMEERRFNSATLFIFCSWFSLLLVSYCHSLLFITVQFISVQSLSHVQLFATPWIAARQASLSITNSRSSLKLTSIESVMPSSHLILCHPLLLLPPIPPSIRVFSSESTLCIRWPKYWILTSASVLPKNTQDWSPLEWTGWISLQSKGLSRVFSNTTAQKHQFFGT